MSFGNDGSLSEEIMNEKAKQLVKAMLDEDEFLDYKEGLPMFSAVLVSGDSRIRITQEMKDACISGEVNLPEIAEAWSELTGKPFDSSRLPPYGFRSTNQSMNGTLRCRRGHVYAERTTRWKHGNRVCLRCLEERQARYRADRVLAKAERLSHKSPP